jgi:hypothetical protein
MILANESIIVQDLDAHELNEEEQSSPYDTRYQSF